MEIFIVIFGVLIAIVIFQIISLNIRMSKSSYTDLTDYNVFNVYFDKGNYGEFLTFEILEKAGIRYILPDVYVLSENGKIAQIDLIAVTEKGIFVLERKNYSGNIYGDEKFPNWTQFIGKGKKYKFYNPIWQNNGHIKALENFLPDTEYNQYISYIIFSKRCTLKKVVYNPDTAKVMRRNFLRRNIKSDMQKLPTVFTPQEARGIYERLKTCCKADEGLRKEHLEQVNIVKNG